MTTPLNADFLQGLSTGEAERILALGTRVTLESGEELFRLGADAKSIYLIAQGRIDLTMPMQIRGREQEVLVEERRQGQTLGWSALIPPYRFTLRAAAPLRSEVIAIPREALTGYFRKHPETGYIVTLNVAAVVGQRLSLFEAMWAREMSRMVELKCA
ncbi:MAG: cyclic nucleotide-binding domain-containing protein [Acidobacteriota bacterium]|nr:cyclic nucleotide-binding domain-containing protein [Acidobacteriota bacterium]